jgi:hypothetical protein
MLDAGRQQRSGVTATGQVRRWVEEQLGLDEPITVLVTELACHKPGCPPIETVIALLGGRDSKTWKIPCPAAELSAADVAAVLARPPTTAAEPHAHRNGCCGVPQKPPAGTAVSPS